MSEIFIQKIIEQVFLRWFGGRTPLERVLKVVIKENRLGSRDRKILAEVSFNLVRFCADIIQNLEKKENPEAIRDFKKGVAEFLENFSVEKGLKRHQSYQPSFEKNPRKHLSGGHGLSQEILNFLENREISFEDLHSSLQAQQGSAPICIRLSTSLKGAEFNKIKLLLTEAGFVESEIFSGSFFSYEKIQLDKILEGLVLDKDYFVQDESSQLVGHFVATKPGSRILDFCAGAGGKSLHLAEILGPGLKIDAWEYDPKRRHELKKRVALAKFKNLNVLNSPPTESVYDSVLVDAPCSGWGTLRRQPDLVFRTQVKDLENYEGIQRELLNKASGLLKKGGILTYSTCSFLRTENTSVMSDFLGSNSNFRLVEYKKKHFTTLLSESVKKLTSLANLAQWNLSLGLKLIPSQTHFSQGSGGWMGDGFFISQVQLRE